MFATCTRRARRWSCDFRWTCERSFSREQTGKLGGLNEAYARMFPEAVNHRRL